MLPGQQPLINVSKKKLLLLRQKKLDTLPCSMPLREPCSMKNFALYLAIPLLLSAASAFTGENGNTLSLSSQTVNSPDGKKIVSARSDGVVQIFDADWNERHQFKGHSAWVRSAVFSSDAKKIITASDDKTIRILDADSGQELQKFDHPVNGIILAAFSSDDTKILTGTNKGIAQLWDADLKNEVQKFEGHTDGIHIARFSPDGEKLVTHSADGTLRIWDVDSGKEIQKLEGLTGFHQSSFLSDGKQLVVLTTDEEGANPVVQIWDFTK